MLPATRGRATPPSRHESEALRAVLLLALLALVKHLGPVEGDEVLRGEAGIALLRIFCSASI